MTTDTLTLDKGYIDENGDAHREVTLRAPGIMDEVEAEQQRAESRYPQSQTYEQLLLLERCIISWEQIAAPSIDHLQALNQNDVLDLMRAVNDLREKDSQQVGNESFDSDADSS
ncbi:MAG: hypothetical protein U5L04_02640 [Trueperaceae bacterium]|nr:hypothetical protein [Trueperaceae bacterium]